MRGDALGLCVLVFLVIGSRGCPWRALLVVGGVPVGNGREVVDLVVALADGDALGRVDPAVAGGDVAMTQPRAIGTTAPRPNISTPMMVQASGVLAAPAKTATKPIEPSVATGMPSGAASAPPRVVPMTNRGVTSPPGKSQPRAMTVNTSFHANAVGPGLMPARVSSMSGRDGPR